MKKTTLRTLFTLLALILVFTMIFTVVACNTIEDTPEEEEKTETKTEEFDSLLTNGNFDSTSGSDQPFTPSGWSVYTNGSNTDTTKKVSGVISTGASYDSTKTAWDSLDNPDSEADNKLLMIYNKEANVYGYQQSYTTESSAYYTLSARIKTVKVAGTGATFLVRSDNGIASFSIPVTEDFKTYTFYIAAPATSSSASIKIYLTLGYGSDKVSGYAFFDNIILKKIKSSDYTNAANDSNLTDVLFTDMSQPDGKFDYFDEATSELKTPNSWTGKSGGEVDGKPIDTSNKKVGIVSTVEENWNALCEANTKYFSKDSNPGTPANTGIANNDDYVLAIRTIADTEYTPTAIGYASTLSVQINRSSLYEISVWVKASVDEKEGEDASYYATRGATVLLNGAEKYSVSKIRTDASLNNGWEKVVFYVFGNPYSDKNLTVEFWLGTDESADTLTQGQAYFDNFKVKNLSTFNIDDGTSYQNLINEYTLKINNIESAAYKTRYADLVELKSVKENMINQFTDEDNDHLPDGYTFAPIDNVVVNTGDVIATLIDKNALAASEEEWTANWKDVYKLEKNPLFPYAFNNVLLVNNVIPSAYKVTQTQELSIVQNLHYRLSVWVKTVDIAESDKLTIAIYDANGNSKKSFTVNTKDVDNELTNDYVECIFYLQGPTASDPDERITVEKVHLEFSFGSGTKYDPSSFKKGAYLIANINMEQITYVEYNKASTTGTYVDKYSFTSSDNTTLSNGNFNLYDLENSKIDQDTGLVKLLDDLGNYGYYLAEIGGDWKNNVSEKFGTIEVKQIVDKDKTADEDKEYVTVNKYLAGILNLNEDTAAEEDLYLKQFGLNADKIYDNWAVVVDAEGRPVKFGNPNLLLLARRIDPTEKPAEVGGEEENAEENAEENNEEDNNDEAPSLNKTAAITSPSMTLEANSYYILKFYARALGNDAIAEVYLTTSSTNAENSLHTVKNENGWVEYNYLVETGLSSVTAKFEIYFGQKSEPDKEFNGSILFDGFSYKKLSDKAAYDEYQSKPNTENAKFTTTTFTTSSTTSSEAEKPALFSGNGETTSGYVNKDEQVAGVITKNSYDYEKLGIYTTETTEDEEGNKTTKDVIIEGSALNKDTIFSTAGMDTDEENYYLLMINNRKNSYYTYQTSTMTVKSGSFYKFSAYVRTAWLAKDKNAYVRVSIDGETYSIKVNTGVYDESGKETIGDWKLINFYIRNDKESDVTDAKLSFTLGENSDEGKLQGYFFIDNVSLSALADEDAFKAATVDFYDEEKTDAFLVNNSVIELKDAENKDEEKDDEDEEDNKNSDSGLNTTLLWTYITSIAIAAVLIAVIVAWLIKKYGPKKDKSGKTKGGASYDRNNASSSEDKKEDGTGSARDEYKD